MSTAAMANRLEPAQQTAARVAGFLYLFPIAIAIFTEFVVRAQLIVPRTDR